VSLESRRPIRISLPTKIFLGFSIILALFAGVLVFNFGRLGRLYEEITVINRGLVPLQLALSDIQGDLRTFSVLLADREPLEDTRPAAASQIYASLPGRIEERLNASLEMVNALAAPQVGNREEPLLLGLRRTIEHLRGRNSILAEHGARFFQQLSDGDAVGADATRRRIGENLVQMQAEVALLSRQTGAVVSNALDWAAAQQRQNVLGVVITAAVAGVLALLIMLWSAKSLRPLVLLSRGVQELRGGAYPTVEVAGRNEFGMLADEFNQMVASLKDRDEALERAHQATLDSEKLATIGRMTSQITHEVRNPLSSIGLNIELLKEELASLGEDAAEPLNSLGTIVTEIDRLTEITEEYLHFARPAEPQATPEDLNELIRQLIHFHGHELSQAGVVVSLDLAEDLPEVLIDERQIRQAILNLVQNAQEAMPDGGRLSVSTNNKNGTVFLEIEDDGVGLDADSSERIFEPFFTTKTRGTGLGLALTKQIITQHGGHIAALAVSAGTCFRIQLPLHTTPRDNG